GQRRGSRCRGGKQGAFRQGRYPDRCRTVQGNACGSKGQAELKRHCRKMRKPPFSGGFFVASHDLGQRDTGSVYSSSISTTPSRNGAKEVRWSRATGP